MKTILTGIFFVLFLMQSSLNAQKTSEFLPDKPGKWTYSTNIKRPGAEMVAFNKNLAVLAEWFHMNVPMLTNPKGFDLLATSFAIWDDNYKKNTCNYGLRSEMNFDFQLFLADLARGGKWTVEPPHYSFYINNTESGHGTNPNWKYFSEEEYDSRGLKKFGPTQQKAINDAVTKMNGVFLVFPFKQEFAPGVKLFGDGNLIVFNPERPNFWLPVTVGEMTEMYLEYYTQLEDEFMLPYLKKEMEEFSEAELDSPAFNSSERTILRFNGNGEGLQFMRFNPDYWNRSLPPSDIQFMTFYHFLMSDAKMEESYRNNGYLPLSQKLVSEINWADLARMIQK